MKFATALACLSMAATADAKKYTNYALDRVHKTRLNLERLHGRGMEDLYDRDGKFQGHLLTKHLKSRAMQGRHALGSAQFNIDALGD